MQTCCEILCMWPFVNACHDQSLISLSTKEPGLKIPVLNFFTILLKPFQNFRKSCKFVCLFNWTFSEKDEWPFVNACHDQSLISLSTKEPGLKIQVPNFCTTMIKLSINLQNNFTFVCLFNWTSWVKGWETRVSQCQRTPCSLMFALPW